ncbi:hypothetical protein BBK14_26155 [Parafrankia soli]|uniref:Glycosyltransferase RgtA/B/C/D-like domain-containing protein n=1 Tax=Parafrankia soli TaxID=2599596 RepID=A0A1S1PIP1_9ACTN|nr:hypothetical protein [Parafrankia soli]OHV21600.1 hypothetical protein BBK14_26155 [Parafrankia soli]
MASSSGPPPVLGTPPSQAGPAAGNLPLQPDPAQPDRHNSRPHREDRWRADRPSAAPRRWGFVRRHAAFLILLTLAVGARAAVLLAYRPALFYYGDSPAYLDQATNRLWAGDWRPSGYPMFLRVIGAPDHLTRLVVVQHTAALLAGVALYAASRQLFERHGPVAAAGRTGGWPAAVVAVPALLAPWVLDLGQFVLADSLFGTLVLGGLVLLAWPGRPAAWRFAVAGLLLGASLTVRTVGYGPLAVGAAGAVVLAVTHWRRAHAAVVAAGAVLAFVLGAAVPVVAYSAWSAGQGKGFTVTAHSGFFLYGRVAPFADCARLPDDPDLLSLCDPRPVGERGSPVTYLWPDDSPLRQGNDLVPPGREELAGEFARRVIREQPWTMVTSTARYLAGYFSPVPYENRLTSRADTWELPRTGTNRLVSDGPHAADGYFSVARLNDPPVELLAFYSRLGYGPMPLVGLGLLAGLLAQIVGRARGRAGPGRLFWLLGGASLSTLLLSSLTSAFDYRYLGSVVGLLAPAALLGAAGLARVLRPRPVDRGGSVNEGGIA